MARVQLFLSTVSAEFLSYRERLRHLLTRPDVEVKVQEDFIVTGDETLEMLDAYIQGCDGVIHLVGDMTGALAKPQSVAAIAERYPELATRFPLAAFLQRDGPSLSYTQWEAWLALLHGKSLFIATPQEGAPRDLKYLCEPSQQALQQAHLSRLRSVARYPGTAFPSQEHLAAEVLRSFVLDLLVQAGLSPIRPTPHNLPDRTTRAERFVGRIQELEQLKNLLSPEGSRAYLTGMGGVGKSELAIQHAYDSFDLYRGGILRLDARQGLGAMALQLVTFFRGRFPDVALPEDRSPTELLPVCWSQWPANGNPPDPVLLILDDQRGDNEGYAAERQLLEGLPPRFRRLITQRETAPTTAQAIDLPLLKREASLELLALQAGEGGADHLQAEAEAANALCSEVGDLPLALVLLGARLSERPDLQLGQLLADLQAKGAEAKALRQAHPELGAKLGVVEALLISWEPLTEPAKSVALLLSVMAPAVIPWELVEACRLPEQELEEGSVFGDQQAEMLRARFLERSEPGLYQLHPLVRQFLKLQSQRQGEVVGQWRKQLTAAVVEYCKERIPQTLTLRQLSDIDQFAPHVHFAAERYSTFISDAQLIWPWTCLARYFANKSDLTKAEYCYKQSLLLCENRLGPNHPDTGISLSNLSAHLQAIYKFEEAEPLMRRALAVDESNNGRNHPDVAVSLNNLATLLRDSGQTAEAKLLFHEALANIEARYGKDHPTASTILSNLALLLQYEGRLEEAEAYSRLALDLDEENLPNNPHILALRLNNLAMILLDLDKLDESESMIRTALAVDRAIFGPTNLHVARDQNNLAQVLQRRGIQRDAENFYSRSLHIYEQRLGANSLEALVVRNNQLDLLDQMGFPHSEI